MRCYRAFGLNLRSEIELPELPEVDGPADVSVVLGPAGVPEQAWHSGRQSWGEPGAAWVFQPTWGAIRVEGGVRFTIEKRDGLSEEGIRVWLLGPAFAILLHQREMFVLHGSAVAVDGAAAVFLGRSGAGKSTTAYACARAGLPVLSDDIVPIEFAGGAPVVRPGIPHLRIAPDVLRGAGDSPEKHAQPIPWEEKRHVRLGQASLAPALTLGAVYVLDEADECLVEPLSPQQAFAALAQNSFLAPLMLQCGSVPWHLEACARLAAAARVRRFAFPRRPGGLAELAAMVRAGLEAA